MSYVGHVGITDEEWVARLLAPRNRKPRPVISRSAAEVEERIGRKELERRVKAAGFRMLQAGDQIVIVRKDAPIRVLV